MDLDKIIVSFIDRNFDDWVKKGSFVLIDVRHQLYKEIEHFPVFKFKMRLFEYLKDRGYVFLQVKKRFGKKTRILYLIKKIEE